MGARAERGRPERSVSLIAALAREHEALRGLVRRIDAALVSADDEARARVRADLLVLLEALRAHEEIETEAFSGAVGAGDGTPSEAAAELEREHAEVAVLREEVRAILEEGVDAAWPELSARSLALCRRLLEHFESEETRLWPREAHSVGRTRERSLSRSVERRVRALSREIERGRIEAADYLTRRR